MHIHKSVTAKSMQNIIHTVRQEVNAWKALDVSLTEYSTPVSLMQLVCEMDSFLGEYGSGEIFICGNREILTLFKPEPGISEEDVQTTLTEIVAPYGGRASMSGINPQALRTIEIKLHDLQKNTTNNNEDVDFHELRFGRAHNKFFVIDESSFVRSYLKKALKNAGEVFEFETTEGVAEAYLKELPDVVFTDTHMPGRKDGIQLLEKLVSYDSTAHVVLQSATREKNYVLRAKQLGAKGFLAKPFTVERVQDEVLRCKTVKPFGDRTPETVEVN